MRMSEVYQLVMTTMAGLGMASGGALGNPEMSQLVIWTSRRGVGGDGQSMPRGIITNIFNSLQFDLKRNRLTN